MRVTLYTTAGCHLCDLALAQLNSLQQQYPLDIHLVEIGDDDDLVAEYGIRIPVIKSPNQAELGWPFDVIQLFDFLQLNCAEL